MKNLLLGLAGLVVLSLSANAQHLVMNPLTGKLDMSIQEIVASGAPSNPCPSAGTLYVDSLNSNSYFCAANGGNWVQNGTGTPGPSPFNCTLNGTTSTTCTHNLSTTSVIVQCYDASSPPLAIIPNSIALTSANVVTVGFTANQTGSCKINGGVGPQGPAFNPIPSNTILGNATGGSASPTALTANQGMTLLSGATNPPIVQGGQLLGGTMTIGTNDANPLNIRTNAATAVTILSNGNVGIGTTAPGYPLEVASGSGTDKTAIKFGLGGYLLSQTSAAMASFAAGAHYNNGWVAVDTGASAFQMYNVNKGDFAITTNTGLTPGSVYTPSPRLVITNTGNVGIGGTITDYSALTGSVLTINGGNVGIGTTTPQTNLEITSTAGVSLRLDSASGFDSNLFQLYNGNTQSALFTYSPSGQRFDIQTKVSNDDLRMVTNFGKFRVTTNGGTSDALTILNNGNVGIGTTTPHALLHAAGNAFIGPATGAITPTGTLSIYDATAATGATTVNLGYDGGGVFGASHTSATTTITKEYLGQSQGTTHLHTWGTNAGAETAYVDQNANFFSVNINYIATENGAANAIACAASSGPSLTPGLVVTIKLAHTLQAGANTFAYNGGAALAIKSHLNTANNIATAYASGALVALAYDGTQWQDMSQ